MCTHSDAVEHRQLLGEPKRVVDRQQVTVDKDLQLLGALRDRCGEKVGRVHQAVRRGVVFVHRDAVEAVLLELDPAVEVLGIGPRRYLWLDELFRKWPSEFGLVTF